MKNLNALGRSLKTKEMKLISGGDSLLSEKFDSVYSRSHSGAPGGSISVRVRGC